MRSDSSRGELFINSDAWKNQKYADKLLFRLQGGPPYYANNSFSGKEANRLFLNDGQSFEDVSGVSGSDHRGDGRGFAILDYDRDGWQDIVLYSTNYPRIKLLKNFMGARLPGHSRIQVKVSGANHAATATSTSSARDAIGCIVVATYQSGAKQARRVSIGEGNVAQNSSLIWFGQSGSDKVVRLDGKWPNGKTLTVALVEHQNAGNPIHMIEPSK